MKKIKAFTLIEVMMSIFIFSSAMLGFMAFHAHTMAVLFENESAQFAHALAFNMIDEINALSSDSFSTISSKSKVLGSWLTDDNQGVKSALGSTFKPSPFNSFGKSGSDNYTFYRAIRVEKYSTQTQVYVQNGTYLSTLYHVEVLVSWPKKEYAGKKCKMNDGYNEEECNQVSIPLVRSDAKN